MNVPGHSPCAGIYWSTDWDRSVNVAGAIECARLAAASASQEHQQRSYMWLNMQINMRLVARLLRHTITTVS